MDIGGRPRNRLARINYMIINILSLFPNIIECYFATSIVGRAVQKGIITYRSIDIRDFAHNPHKSCDDAPYGGGAGMIMTPEPLGLALDSVSARTKRTIFPTPSGKRLSSKLLSSLVLEQELVFICGRYEGIDQRIIDIFVSDEISIGDWVISSGELAALVIIDGMYRLLEGAISHESLDEESFRDGLLEYPHYTRPSIWRGHAVPSELLSGNHAKIRTWRKHKQLEKTCRYRSDLLRKPDN